VGTTSLLSERRGRRTGTETGARVALLFPGQGSQRDGLRELVAEHRPDLLELATELTGDDPFERIEEGTRFQQPAIYSASLACWTAAGRPRADLLAGHSLGELAALVAGGALDELDGLRLAVTRGRLMQEAADRGPKGGMVAVLGDDRAARRLAARFDLALANANAPGQTVLSGLEPGLSDAIAAAREQGVRSVRLAINGAFHTQTMRPAVPAYRAMLAATEFRPVGSVYSSTTGRPFEDVRRQLAESLTGPVRWRQTLTALRRAGAERFVEAGPGKVLTNLVRRTLDGVEAKTLDPEMARV
jgi:[acyl-carrier-protein] S-malonyltransferase